MTRRALVLAALLAAAGCDQPPLKEVAAAEAMVEKARQDGAETLVPERFREAQSALDTARQKLREKDYRAALSSALDASERARSASKAAAAARALAATAAVASRAEIEATLEEVSAVEEQARKDRVPEAVFEPLQPKADQARQRLAAITTEPDPVAARKAAAELRAEVRTLPDEFRQAAQRWQAEHPRGRARRRR